MAHRDLNLEEESKLVQAGLAQFQHVEESLKDLEADTKKAQRKLESAQAAQCLLQSVSQLVQAKVHEKLSQVVSNCLSTVFDNPYTFTIVFERKRGKTEANLRFQRDGLDVDPLTASGGGMVDVAAFALRVACLLLHRPRLNRVVILDEAFKFVSAQYRDNVRAMLDGLAKDLDIQIIQVTHIQELETGSIVEL